MRFVAVATAWFAFASRALSGDSKTCVASGAEPARELLEQDVGDTALLQLRTRQTKTDREVEPPSDVGQAGGVDDEVTREDGGVDDERLRKAEQFMADQWREEEEKCHRDMRRVTLQDQAEDMRYNKTLARDFGANRGIDLKNFSTGPGVSVDVPPPNIARVGTFYKRCHCQTGLDNVTFWPDDDRSSSVTVRKGEVRWVTWGRSVSKVRFFCDQMEDYKEQDVGLAADQLLSVMLEAGDVYAAIGTCRGETSGYLHMNTWAPTAYTSSIPFTTGTEGYSCFKIPALFRTQKGTLIAFAEARRPTCSDFAPTDTVYKRSSDGGKTWGPLQTLVKLSEADKQALGICGNALVVGNIAPVQLRADAKYHPGRILVPYTRNNFKAWIVYSDDDGVTWNGDRELVNMTVTDPGVGYADAKPDCQRGMSYFGLRIDYRNKLNPGSILEWLKAVCYVVKDPYFNPFFVSKLTGAWQWIGIGPPGGLELSSGRILIPSYHSHIRGLEGDGALPVSQLYNNFALGHTMISDDGGDTWRLGFDWELGNGANENQMVEFPDGEILTNSRSLATGSPQFRLQARSNDGGDSFSASDFIDIPQPFNGCQGSTILGGDGAVYVSGPDPSPPSSWAQTAANLLGCKAKLTGRDRVTIWRSTDKGKTYPQKQLIDPGLSAQTSLQSHNGQLLMLYEQADPEPVFTVSASLELKAVQNLKVLLPDRFVYREVKEGVGFEGQ